MSACVSEAIANGKKLSIPISKVHKSFSLQLNMIVHKKTAAGSQLLYHN